MDEVNLNKIQKTNDRLLALLKIQTDLHTRDAFFRKKILMHSFI